MTPEQTLDWLAEQHKSQCNEDRPVQEWIRGMKSMLPAPVQEPVAWWNGEYGSPVFAFKRNTPGIGLGNPDATPLYTTPPAAQRQWVGLTDEQIDKLFGDGPYVPAMLLRDVARAIEAKLKEKNSG
jgi:hypothetical protein